MKGSIYCLLLTWIIWNTIASSSVEKGRRFEVENCEEIIPKFIDHISEFGDDSGECGEVGKFPKPGDCTVFFKCVRGRGRILPILEYCAIGYNFDGQSCVPGSNSTDCPQFNCKVINDTEAVSDDGESTTNTTSLNIMETTPEMGGSVSMSPDMLQSGASTAAQQVLQIENWKNNSKELKATSSIVLFLYVCIITRYID